MKIRRFEAGDDARIKEIYQTAFSGYPWFREISDDEVNETWVQQSTKHGFTCFVALIDNALVGSFWYDQPSLKQLQNERGEELVEFVKNYSNRKIIWFRETCVDPKFQRFGVARQLKSEMISQIESQHPRAMILTRMRDDNIGIVRINTDLGFKKNWFDSS